MAESEGPWKPKDMTFLATAFLCLKEAPTIDFEKLAPRLGYTNSRSAQNYWGALQKRIHEMSLNDKTEGSAPLPSSPKKRAGGRGKKIAASSPATKEEVSLEKDSPAGENVDHNTPDAELVPPQPSTPPEKPRASANASPRKRKASASTEGELAKTPRRSRKASDGSNASPRKKSSSSEVGKRQAVPSELPGDTLQACAAANAETTGGLHKFTTEEVLSL